MKRLIILMIEIILLIIIVIAVFNGISIGKISIYSVKDIKQKSENLDKKIEEAKIEITQKHAKSISEIEQATVNLKKVKQEFDEKIGTNNQFKIAEIEKYKIEYLWSRIGAYGRDERIKQLFLDVKDTSIKYTYDVGFTVVGPYVSVIDFLYDIENDDELNYRISNFKLEPYIEEQVSGQKKERTDILQASFVVENIIINFN